MVSNPLELLWIGRATIYEYQDVTDTKTYQTTQKLVKIATDEKCRLSYTRETTVSVDSGAPYVTQTIVLFIRPDLNIKEGSVIEITQRGVTTKYKRASKPTIYTNHQELALELYEGNA